MNVLRSIKRWIRSWHQPLSSKLSAELPRNLFTQRLLAHQHNWALYVIYGLAFCFVVYFFAFLVLPLGVIIKSAFIGDKGFTLTYFKLLLESQQFIITLYNSCKLALVTTVITTMVALPLALINTKFTYWGKQLLSSLFMSTMFLPPFVGSIGILHFFSQYGTVNRFLMDLHLITAPILFLRSYSIAPIVFIQVLNLYPVMYLSLSTTLHNIDPSIDEVSITLGISRLRRYKDIIWPLARPGFFSGAVLSFVWSFTDLGTPLITNFTQVLSVSIYHELSTVYDNPYAYAMVFAMMAITIFFVLFLRGLLKVDKRHRMLSKNYVKRPIVRPTYGQLVVIYLFVGAIVCLSLLPHVGVVITSLGERWFNTYLPEAYTLDGYYDILRGGVGLVGIQNSTVYATIATCINVIFGIFVAYVIANKHMRFKGLLDVFIMIPLFLPGLILAFGYILTYTDTPLDPMYSPALLVIAYSIRYMPYTVRSLVASLQQMNPNLEEASRLFGASWLQTMRFITLPIVVSSLIAGAFISFARAMLEVSDSLILAFKEDSYPIAKVIHGLYGSQGDGQMKASALGVVAMLLIACVIYVASRMMGKKMGQLFRITAD